MRTFLLALFAVAAAAQDLPDGPGKADVVKVCDSCHGVSTLTGEARTASQWNDVVNDMVSRGATGSDEELRRVVDYLAKTFPVKAPTKINVNTTPAKDLEAKLEISTKEAEALVRYRDQNGKFQSFDDLKKVPGVDLKKIEAKRERLTF
jgi:competence protein ComEA